MLFRTHIGTFLIFAAFVMLLVVSVSAPIWGEVAFLMLEVGYYSRETIAFGNWGYCILLSGGNQCSASSVGYDILGVMAGYTPLYGSAADTVYTLSGALVLHPIACFFAFLSFLTTLASRKIGLLSASLVAMIAVVITLTAVIIDWIIFVTVYYQVNGSSSSLGRAYFSSAIILVTVSLGVLILGSVTTCLRCVADRRRRGFASGPPY